jgi:5-formyltetrahydrofolate cyclo-ligase
LHRQVLSGIEQLALATPLDDTAALPTEAQLSDHFGVSRGTVRKATEELVRRGLLRSEAGRGTFVDKRAQARAIVRARLVQVARADSRFDLDIAQFVPDFDGSDRCHDAVRALDEWRSARTVFVAPDNSLEELRRLALDDGKAILVPTYGMRRGFVLLHPEDIAPADRRFAASLDGTERLGQVLTLDELVALDPIDIVVTGATAVTLTGAHVGGGQAYLDLEWGILAELGLAGAATPTVCIVHDCQVLGTEVVPGPFDVTIDIVITPTVVHPTQCSWRRPAGLDWQRLDVDLLHRFAYLADLHERRGPHTMFTRET